MEQAILSSLPAWGNFYVIIGSSSAALTGLQFVVMVLSAQVSGLGGGSSVRAFGTPTIVHFCSVLLISAIMSASWPVLSSLAFALGICGAAGLGYAVMVVRHARRQIGYAPVLEDWIWHAVLPILTYAALLVVAFLLQSYPMTSLFVVGGTVLLLLFIGIHNAWDAVVYIALQHQQQLEGGGDPK